MNVKFLHTVSISLSLCNIRMRICSIIVNAVQNDCLQLTCNNSLPRFRICSIRLGLVYSGLAFYSFSFVVLGIRRKVNVGLILMPKPSLPCSYSSGHLLSYLYS